MGTLQIYSPTGTIIYKNVRNITAIEIVAKIRDLSWRYFTDHTVITHGEVECARKCGGCWNKGCYLCIESGQGRLSPGEVKELVGCGIF